MRSLLLIFSVLMMQYLTVTDGVAAPAPVVGTMITNQAQSTYLDTATGFRAQLNTNTVRVKILPLEALALTVPQQLFATPGTFQTLLHTLTNTGNITTSYTISASNMVNDQFDLSTIKIIHDLNGNGIPDAGEAILLPTTSITLKAGQRAKLLVSGLVPITTIVGQRANILVTANSTTTAISASNTDVILTENGANITLRKQVDLTTVNRNGLLTYTIIASNTGNLSALPMSLFIDGIVQRHAIIRDNIPVNTTFSAFTDSLGGTPLYHIAGSALHRYVSVAPAPLSSVDAIAVMYPELPSGATRSISFTVNVHANASGVIPNGALFYYTNAAGSNQNVLSNIVESNVPVTPPTIHYYTNNTLTAIKPVMIIGDPLHIGADAAECNVDPLVAEQHPVQVTSLLTGDIETFTFIETGLNTGVFHYIQPSGIPTANGNIIITQLGNGVIETIQLDTLTASVLGCGVAVTVKTKILVDPGGVVFDSLTGLPVANVTVTLIDVTGGGNGGAVGGLAVVFATDGVTPAPSTVVTDVYGRFQFPFVSPSSYRLQIARIPAPGYVFSSIVPVGMLPAGFTILGDPNNVATSGSYGGVFNVTIASGIVVLDVPIDPAPTIGLFVKKTASRTDVQLGEFLDYTVTIRNTLTVPLYGITLFDLLPHGFSYMPSTIRQDGVVINDPTGGRGPSLQLPIGTILAGAQSVITYRIKIGPGSMQGNGVNKAWASNALQRSNVALATVNVTAGLLGDQAYLFGKVYMDCDSSRMQGEEEVGIPGVRLYLENGTFAITDIEGKWSLYGLKPRTHVVKIDRITLPKDAQLINLSNRNGGDPNSQFVDLKNGGWHRADFALSNCTKAIRAEVYERRDQGQVLVSELQRSMQQGGIRNTRTLNRSTIASGMITPRTPVAGIENSKVSDLLNAANSNLPEAPIRPVMQVPIEKRMPLMDTVFGFVDLHNGDVLPYHQTDVLIKGRTGSAFLLWVNGKEVSAKKVGQKSTLASKSLAVWQYIGLNLEPGKNTLQATMRDAFGNDREHKMITVIVPGDMANVKITVPESADADGHSKISVLVELLDADQVPVTVRTPLTLESSLGRWLAKDVNPVEPGIQVFMQGGKHEFILIAPQTLGEAKIRVSSGAIGSTAQLDFLPALRPMIAVGVIEGRVQLNSFNLRNILPVRQRDSFEQQLRLASSTDGKRDVGARAAVFLKGRVLGSYLLTAAYDSDKTTNERLFRDIQPDAFYPIYGDSAVKGFEAQSTTRLYVRVDHDRSWLLYGDFTTQADVEDVRKLSVYNRTLTGVKHHLENKIVRVESFATRDVSRQVTQEIAANGTSGPYYLASTAMLINSDKLEILTRDRNQPSVILQTKALQRFADYQIEAMTGRIILAAPIASLDANLNPQALRVTYELDQGGKEFWTAGTTASLKLGDHVVVGATHVQDQNPLNPSKLSGAHGQLKLGETVTATAEFARTKDLLSGQGNAKRAEILFKQGRTQGRVYAASTDVAFSNSSAYLNKGREEAGLELNTALTSSTRAKVQLLHTKNRTTGAQRRGLETSVSQRMGDLVNAELGYRQSNDTQGGAVTGALTTPNQQRSARLKLSSQVPGLQALGIYGEYERALNNSGQRRASIGGDYQFANQGKLYARHEFLTSNSGAFGLNNRQNNASTVVGIDTSYMQDGKLFSEYRARDAISGREDQATIGLRNGWMLDEGLRLNTNLERIRVLNGPGTKNSTTVGTGLEYTANPLFKASGRLEYHFGTAENSVLTTLGLSRKLNLDWSLLAKNTFSRRVNRLTSGTLSEDRLQIGLAYRQTLRNHVSWLAMYELTHKSDTTAGTRTLSHLLSTHVNYQPVRSLTLSGRYALKWLNDNLNGTNFRYGLQLMSGRAMLDITERWDAGLIASTLFSNGFATSYNGFGVETGYMMQSNLWLSVGFNVFGFHDREGLANQYTNQGVFVRLRYKFDETLFDAEPQTIQRGS